MLTNWTPERPFIDPFCGSGTLPIEAALIGQNIAPGFNREFVSEGWDWIPQKSGMRLERKQRIWPNMIRP